MTDSTYVDTATAALLMLAEGAVNADHAAAFAPDLPVVSVHGWPVPIGQVPAGQWPMLVIHRVSEAAQPESEYDFNTTAQFRIEYWQPPTGADRMALRWASLHAIWRTILIAFQGGMHLSVSSGASVLAQAGIRAKLGSTSSATYSIGNVDGGQCPHFIAQMRFEEAIEREVGVLDVDGLPNFITSHLAITLPDSTVDDEPIEQTITLDGFAP